MFKNLSNYQIYLASTSPRRIEILSQILNVNNDDILKSYDSELNHQSTNNNTNSISKDLKGFKLIKPNFKENLNKELFTPEEYVKETALHKLKSIDISKQLFNYDIKNNNNNISIPNVIIISADTIISFEGTIIEKPHSKIAQLANLLKFKESKDGINVITSVVIKEILTTTNNENNNDYIVKIHEFQESTLIKFDSELSQTIFEDYIETNDGFKVAGGFKIQKLGGLLIKEIHGDYYNVVGLPLNSTFKVLKKIIDG
ncbi:hypothetical protein WICMUC_003980 [Wickerhamomyces mucosus]|uniref:Maf-like protein n=1 Tax=Wickerhamomyces mucosus TaxID=1378264 RepID=A0A9P8PIJ9_9ASCO|nr:hypothetical protein WICMUC_003980 [Wickerhamomyces mucosus]